MSVLTKIVFATAVTIAIGIEPALAGDNVVCPKDAAQCSSGTIIFLPLRGAQDNVLIAKLCNFDKSITAGMGAIICVRK